MNTQPSPYIVPGVQRLRLSLEQAGTILMHHLGTDLETLRLKSRRRPIVRARQSIAYLLYWYGFTLTAIGRWLMKDHATMTHSVKTVNNDMLSDHSLREFIATMKETLENR